MLRLISHFRKTLGGLMAVFGIFWLPKDIQDYGEAAKPWQQALAMIDRQNALFALCAVLLLLLMWSEGRIYWRDRLAAKRVKLADLEPNASWHEGRTRLTLREMACKMAGVTPLEFDTSPRAQSLASELQYYVGEGMIDSPNISQAELDLRKIAFGKDYKYQPISLDIFIDEAQIDRIERPHTRTWWSAVDKVNKDRA